MIVDPGDTPPSRRINIARLIMIYVKKFEITNQLEALHYYFMLRYLNHGKKNLFMLSISDIAQETKAYDYLFGRMQQNGVRTPGIVDQFITTSLTVEGLCEMLARDLQGTYLINSVYRLCYNVLFLLFI